MWRISPVIEGKCVCVSDQMYHICNLCSWYCRSVVSHCQLLPLIVQPKSISDTGEVCTFPQRRECNLSNYFISHLNSSLSFSPSLLLLLSIVLFPSFTPSPSLHSSNAAPPPPSLPPSLPPPPHYNLPLPAQRSLTLRRWPVAMEIGRACGREGV